ncbi:Trichodiene oxygenase [Echria macrotheca]|uniref:Trichodiene oxygenase n=1 Tax=Echria macrotheca TaxID=438768 RepID=A0AAJ0B9K2_9PEZI|nr:Trichodiene oxygenase [Echria macrotheca]
MAITFPGPLPFSAVSLLAWSVAAYFAWLVVYRCFLSPLARIPGPMLAGLTYWYECYYDVIQPAQYVFKIKEMHEKYGPIVRIGPNDVSIVDPDFIDTVYAPGPGHKRDKDYTKNKALGVDSSVGGAIAHDLHRRRREALNPCFSPQRIHRNLDSKLKDKASQLEHVFSQAKERGEVLNLSDVYFAFANDIVHEYCFGNSPNLLGDLALAHTRRTNVAAVLGSVKVMLHFSWLRDLTKMLPQSIASGMTPPGVRDMIAFRRNIRAQIDRILASSSSSSSSDTTTTTPSSIFTHLRDSPSLPPSEKSAQRLEDEATLLVMAGTYSPMLSLVTAHYHLLANPTILSNLRAELLPHKSSLLTIAELEQLPYLSGIIHEAHRLTFGLTGRNARVSPDDSLTYKSYNLPAGTSISVPTLVVHTDESLFPDPWRFDPERWIVGTMGNETMVRRRMKALLAFGRGPRACVGMHLADAQMAVAVAAMASWEMGLFETHEGDVRFCHDYHVLCPRLGSRGVRVEVLGKEE